MTNPTINVLSMTSHPILNRQWLETFLGWQGYDMFNIIEVRKGDVINPDTLKNNGKLNVIQISFQDAKGNDSDDTNGITENECVAWSKQKFNSIGNIFFDFVLVDESHDGVETPKTDALLENIDFKHLIYCSATPGRNLMNARFTKTRKITKANAHFWDLVDEQTAKKSGETEYQEFEDIKFIVPRLDDAMKKMTEQFSDEEGFTFKKFLSPSEDNPCEFKETSAVRCMFNMLFGTGEYIRNKMSINKLDCRGILIVVPKKECIPPVVNMLNGLVCKSFNIHHTTSTKINDIKGFNSGHNVEELYKLIHGEWSPAAEKGTIVVVVGQLKTGVTLPWCDSVVIMDDCKSSSEWIQTVFRCQSPRPKTHPRFGKGAFVFDMNIKRVIGCMDNIVHLRQCVSGLNYETSLRQYLECCPIYTMGENGVEFEILDNTKFSDMYIKHHVGIGGKNMFSDHIDTFLITGDELLLKRDINKEGNNKYKQIDTVYDNDDVADTGKTFEPKSGVGEINSNGSDESDKEKEKYEDDDGEETPQEKAKRIVDILMRDTMMISSNNCMSLQDIMDEFKNEYSTNQ